MLGWAQVVKGFLSFVAPQVALWGLGRVSHERAWHFIAAGVVTLALCAVLWYVVLTN